MKNIEKLINLINKENLFENLSENNFEEFFDVYMLTCDIDDISDEFYSLQNQYLRDKYSSRVIDIKQARRMKVDPLDIRTDLLIVFTENVIVDDHIELDKIHDSIDNELIIRGGVQIKDELFRQYEQDRYMISFRCPYIIDGANLPAKNVTKIIVDAKSDDEIKFQKIQESIDHLVEWVIVNKPNNCIVCLNDNIKNNKNVKKYIKKALKSAKIREILEFS